MSAAGEKIAMEPHTAERLVRAVQIVAALSLSFAGCTCAGNRASAPPPTATRPAATATVAPRPTDTAPAAPTPAQAAPAQAAPAPAQTAAAQAVLLVPAGSPCADFVAVLSGRKQDAAMLAKPELRAIASADLIMCGAVFSDSDDLCNRLMPFEQGPGGACLQTRALFHELRAYPGKPSFMFDEFHWKQWRSAPVLTEYADAMQQALRAGKREDCDRVGDGASICRAFMTGDKTLCKVTGKLAEVSVPDPKGGDAPPVRVKDVLEANCRETIESRTFLAKGLEAVAASGPPRERELARAALRRPDACAAYAKAALDLCTGPPVPNTPPGDQAPATPAAGTPAGAGAPPEARERG